MRRLAVLLCLVATVAAQDLTHKAGPQKTAIAIVGATIHPVSGPPIDHGFIVFDKGRIVQIGSGKVDFPAGVRRIEAAGRHVYPGFIAPFTRLGLVEIGAVRATRDFNEVGELTPEVRAAVAVNPDSTLLPVTRSNGILTFAVFPSGGAIPGRASVMRMDGWTWEDMALRADAGLVVSWPSSRPRRRRATIDPERLAEQRKLARKQHRVLDEAFTQARAYLAARAADPQTSLDIRWEAMRAVLEGKRPVFFQANEYDQIVGAAAFAKKHGLRAVVVGGRDAYACRDLLKRDDVAVILGGVNAFPKRADSDYDEVYRLPARLEAAGVRWCLASGERTANERNLPYAAARAVAYGLSRDAALRSITLRAAQILGVADRIGSLEKGKDATLLVCDGDPLLVTTNVVRAFIDGREIDLSNKQTKLDAKYRSKYRQLK